MSNDISDLKISGIGRVTINRLIDAGYSLKFLAVASPSIVSKTTGVPVEKVRLIAAEARKILGLEGEDFITAKKYMEIRKNIEKISTGCKALDNLLLGGVETEAITEFIGEFGAGKTQICHQLAVMVQLSKDEGGLDGRAVYIDSEGTFRPERIVQIANAKGLNHEEVLENIIYARVYNTDHQMFLIRKIFDFIDENIKLVIVDSLISNFRSEYPGRENLATRQQLLNAHVHDLLKLSMYNIAVVVTNQVVSSPDVFFGNPLKPAGGNVVAHGCTYRIWLKKGKENKRIAKIIDSPYMAEIETVFAITEDGVVDV